MLKLTKDEIHMATILYYKLGVTKVNLIKEFNYTQTALNIIFSSKLAEKVNLFTECKDLQKLAINLKIPLEAVEKAFELFKTSRWISYDELYDLYITQALPTSELTKRFNTTPQYLHKLLTFYGLNTSSNKNRTTSAYRRLTKNKDTLRELLVKQQAIITIADLFEVSRITLMTFIQNTPELAKINHPSIIARKNWIMNKKLKKERKIT